MRGKGEVQDGEVWAVVKLRGFICRYLGTKALTAPLSCTAPSPLGQGSPRPPQVQCFARRTHMVQHLVILMAKIYYHKRLQSKISKGKPGTGFQEACLSRVKQDTLNYPNHKS